MIFHYREKNKIEELLRTLKSLLKLRPFYVYKKEHVHTHYSIGMVAAFLRKYLAQKLIENNLKENSRLLRKRFWEPSRRDDAMLVSH